MGGSGYDIAVAQEKSAILYQNNPRKVERVEFNPSFTDDLIFIHLNQKQDSREGIRAFQSQKKSLDLRTDFSEITQKVLQCETLEEFSNLMMLHESKLSEFLGMKTAKEKHFQDYPSFIKSLGAWGGDFVLASKFGDYKNYFFERNFRNIIEWKNLIY